MQYPVIAIDGTAASGKSTFSKALAQRLGYVYVNTGAMYRGVTWYLQHKGTELSPEAIAAEIDAAGVETSLVDGELAFKVGGLDPLPHVREAKINEAVSIVAQVGPVRKLLVSEQQKLGAFGPVIMEGRDIGTVVFPGTPHKFYIDADAEVRAQRRSAQGEVDSIKQRDAIDSSRKESPLTCAADAFRLDSGPPLRGRTGRHRAQAACGQGSSGGRLGLHVHPLFCRSPLGWSRPGQPRSGTR